MTTLMLILSNIVHASSALRHCKGAFFRSFILIHFILLFSPFFIFPFFEVRCAQRKKRGSVWDLRLGVASSKSIRVSCQDITQLCWVQTYFTSMFDYDYYEKALQIFRPSHFLPSSSFRFTLMVSTFHPCKTLSHVFAIAEQT